ncbi:M12 family metallopeptidase [Myxococcus sp. RHSTA-1-4]|uniref:M12 family metallopeptidase n=1 Tax=Myxococcus sp. RHSTA-1-4 TaxID=2874601 RepID=UPI001CBAB03B|nr:M12 family metallopeptidase [Myxococcus sp. RHSTA-1-4]MBZ4415243.1 M12 family metallopeptidase [Myxococcus sp. RHSTA-1-4]
MRRIPVLVSLAALMVLPSACGPEAAASLEKLAGGGARGVELAMPEVQGTQVIIEGPGGTHTLEVKAGQYVFQGDILLTEEQVEVLRGDESRLQSAQVRPSSAALSSLSKMWPFQTVYYVINGALPDQGRVTSAIAHWQANTNLRFVPRTTQPNYVEFVRGSGCSSLFGMVGGRQVINLADNCSTGNTIHEIGHAVGLLHEQTRQDRDNHVIIHWNNIQYGMSSNFQKYTQQGIDAFDKGAFDFDSVMMYDSYSFSANGLPTITRLNGTTFFAQRDALSAGDLSMIQWVYGGPYARIESQLLYASDNPDYVHEEHELSVTFWSDRNHTIPATLGKAITLQYTRDEYRWWPGGGAMYKSNVSVSLQPGSHKYLLASPLTTVHCEYDYGNIRGECFNVSLNLRDGFGYATSSY